MSEGLLGWLVSGLIVGVHAKLILGSRDPGGFVVLILLGIAGALLGGLLGWAFGLYTPGDADGWIAATLGAGLAVLIYRMIVTRRQV